MEETYKKLIENGIRAINMKTKTPQEANIGKYLNKLKLLNEGIYEDLMIEYKKAIKSKK